MPASANLNRAVARSKVHVALEARRLPKVAVKTLRQRLGLNRKQFARLTAASERAVADWENGRPISPVLQKSLRESDRLCQALMRIIKAANVGDWLDAPNEAFFGLKPLDLIERGEVDRLWRMIFEVQSGALT